MAGTTPQPETHNPSTSTVLEVRDLGKMPYQEAYQLQKTLLQEVIDSRSSAESKKKMYLLLVEHDPAVITITKRKGAENHLIATPEQLKAAGVEVAATDRGGDITYHGPGQLVVYPILDLNVLNLRIHSYMRFLEQIVIDTLSSFGIEGQRDKDATGVWLKQTETEEVQTAKICAMGVRVSRWVAMHGLALNVSPNLDHYNLIIPCGLMGRTVTSIQKELCENCPSMQEVKEAIVKQFNKELAN